MDVFFASYGFGEVFYFFFASFVEPGGFFFAVHGEAFVVFYQEAIAILEHFHAFFSVGFGSHGCVEERG